MWATFGRVPERWVIVLAILVVGAFSVMYSIRLADVNNTADQNHRLICLLDRLFGLDKPLPAKELRRLSPGQRVALRSIIASCPELSKR